MPKIILCKSVLLQDSSISNLEIYLKLFPKYHIHKNKQQEIINAVAKVITLNSKDQNQEWMLDLIF